MYSNGTLIRSSIVSIAIVAIGLFLLCVSRAPKIETNQPIVNGSNGQSEDPDILALLNEADGEISSPATSTNPVNDSMPVTNSSNSDDELASLLTEANDVFGTEANTSSENEMQDLMQLLGEDESQNQQPALAEEIFNANPASEQQNAAPDETLEALLGSDSSTEDTTDLSAIRTEIAHLETVLQEKDNLKQQLKQQISEYDRRIAELESRLTNPMTDDNFYASSSAPTAYGSSEVQSSQPISFNNSNLVADFEIKYKDALQLFYDHHYQDAANQFFALLQINPNHELADNCQYWIGECYYAQGKYYQAIAEFNKVAAFDAADKKDDAQLMLGLCFLKLGEKDLAQTELNWLVNIFASSEYVNKAYRYLNQL